MTGSSTGTRVSQELGVRSGAVGSPDGAGEREDAVTLALRRDCFGAVGRTDRGPDRRFCGGPGRGGGSQHAASRKQRDSTHTWWGTRTGRCTGYTGEQSRDQSAWLAW